jgi:hypothetical protein
MKPGKRPPHRWQKRQEEIPMRSTRLGLMQRVSAVKSPMPNFGKAGLRDNAGKLAYLLSRNGLR